MFAFVVSFGIN